MIYGDYSEDAVIMSENYINSLNLTGRATNYLQDVTKLLENSLHDRLLSIIIFGSLVKGYATEESDADILIVLSDDCSKKEIQHLHQLINAYEVKYKYLIPPKGIISRILYSIDKSTGMFISHFIARKKDFLKGSFAKTFQVNKLLAMVLAPNQIVYGSVLCRAKMVYGANIIKESKIPNVPMTQLLKSIMMNAVTSLFTLLIYPLTKRATLYEMETAKWSFLASYYYLKHDSPGLPILLKFFQDRNITPNYLKEWVQLRNAYHQDPKFGLLTPLNILRIHLGVLKTR
jgi:predicted nucleotidyltransferase